MGLGPGSCQGVPVSRTGRRGCASRLRGHPSLGLCLGCEYPGTGSGRCAVWCGLSMRHPSPVPSLSTLGLRRALPRSPCGARARVACLHACMPPPGLAPAGVYVCVRLLPGPSARQGARSTSNSFASLQFSIRHRSRPTYMQPCKYNVEKPFKQALVCIIF